MTYRSKLGVGGFGDFCATSPQAGSYTALCDLWTCELMPFKGDPNIRDIMTLIKYGLMVVRYEPGNLVSDTVRAREHMGVLIHRDRFETLQELAESDETFEYMYTDADSEMKLVATDKTVNDTAHRKPTFVAQDGDYHAYAFLHFPIGPLFDLKFDLANHILNNFVYVQVTAREYMPSTRIIIWWKCLLELIIKNAEVNIQHVDVHSDKSSESSARDSGKVRD